MRIKSDNKISKVFAFILIPCLLYLTYIAASWGMADMYARPVIFKLIKWKRGEIKLTQDEWVESSDNLSKALKLDPNNPELHQWMGNAIEGPYRSYFSDNILGGNARRLAADHYRTSIRLQPTWPHAWSDLAMVKYRSAEIDDEFYEAVQTAIAMGPWESPILSRFIRMAIAIWPDVPETYKDSFLTIIFHSLQHRNRNFSLDSLRLLNRTGILTKVSAENSSGVVSGILRFLDNGNPTNVKEMLMMLDKQSLWSALSVEQKDIVNNNLERVLVNANPAYVTSVNEILEVSGMGEELQFNNRQD